MLRVDRTAVELPPVHGLTLQSGEKIISHSSGGGGYGAPDERNPQRVLHDAREGWISLTRARDTYGVVLTGSREMDDLALDEVATAAARAKLRAGRASAA
jgi:N-methylhydantoinase B